MKTAGTEGSRQKQKEGSNYQMQEGRISGCLHEVKAQMQAMN